MSQADDAHRTETKASSGNLIFFAGIALYVTTLAVCYAFLGIDSERGGRAFGVLIVMPVGFIAFTFILLQVVFFFGFLSSVPHASWAYAAAVIRRDWKVLVGTLLILTTLTAVLAAAVVSL